MEQDDKIGIKMPDSALIRSKIMLTFLYQTMSHLWFGLAVFLIIFFICSRTAFFHATLFQQHYSWKNRLHIIAFFSLLGILNTYWSLWGESWLINTSSIFIIVAGLVSGPLIGFAVALLIAGHYILLIHTKAALVSGCFFLIEGLLSGFLSAWLKHKKEMLPHAIGISFIFAASHIILLALFCYPYKFTPAIEDCALQVMITTALGTGCFIGLIKDSYKQKDILEGLAAKIALNITNSSISVLQNGFDQKAAQKITESILQNVKSFDVVCITSNSQLLGCTAFEQEQPFLTYLQEDIEALLAEKFCPANEKLTVLTSYLALPVTNGTATIGYLFVGHIVAEAMSAFETRLAEGIAAMLSTHIESNQIKERTKLLADAEIKALQAQINPHFLFNALNTISYYCGVQPQTAKKLINYLADYYRQNLADPNTLISLRQELQHINAYINIEMARFGDRLKINYYIDDTAFFKVPALILQPIIENSVKHGLHPKLDGGTITITVKNCSDYFFIAVHDDGIGIPAAKLDSLLQDAPDRKSIGLVNINKRLLAIYGPDNGLRITSTYGTGTTVSFTIPKQEED